jgi:hypothetical protein
LVEDVGGAAPAIDVGHFRFVLPFPRLLRPFVRYP